MEGSPEACRCRASSDKGAHKVPDRFPRRMKMDTVPRPRRHRNSVLIIAATMILGTVSAEVIGMPFAAASARASGSWALIGANPWPGMSAFGGVSCPTTSDCWAVGTTASGDGAVFATTDARKSWSSETVPAGVTSLSAVSCPSTSNCWALGDDGTVPVIIALVSGTWAFQTIPSLEDPTNTAGITCPSGQTLDCWAVIGAAVPAESTFYILNTTDGGSTWSKEQEGGETVNSVYCDTTSFCLIGATDYYAGLPEVYVSTNGTSWTAHSLLVDGYVQGISCISSSECWIDGVISNSGTPIILQTTDGGSSWSTEATLPSGDSFYDISCPSASDCWIVGTDSTTDSGVMLATADGGTAWNAGVVPSAAEDINALSCAAPYICSAVSSTSSGVVMLGTVVQITTLSLPGATRGTEYSYQLDATGGRPTYRWTLASGSLPKGITMSSSGLLSGKPRSSDQPGVYNFKVKVTDSTPHTHQTVTQGLSLTLS
jgi:photosystem II stability/assembly factor-like uncharacterized protein